MMSLTRPCSTPCRKHLNDVRFVPHRLEGCGPPQPHPIEDARQVYVFSGILRMKIRLPSLQKRPGKPARISPGGSVRHRSGPDDLQSKFKYIKIKWLHCDLFGTYWGMFNVKRKYI